MKNYVILVCCCTIFGCTNQQNTVTKTDLKKDSTRTTVTTPQAETVLFTILTFDKNNTSLKDSIKGKIIDGTFFKDAEGESTVLLTETENLYKGSTQNKSIYAYCFTKKSDAFIKKWVVQDNIEACDFDATCEFFPGSLAATDIDSNHIAEVSFIYKLSCRSDVSPDGKKLIMYQGADKFAIRGTTILQTPAGKEGGDKKIDASFNSAPKVLLEYANKQWNKFGFEKY
jgi:hypothetical protein